MSSEDTDTPCWTNPHGCRFAANAITELKLTWNGANLMDS